MTQHNWDYIIVGAGSAGCVLANRLSADPDVRVLLLEAGGDNNAYAIRMPAGLASAIFQDRYNWKYPSQADPTAPVDATGATQTSPIADWGQA